MKSSHLILPSSLLPISLMRLEHLTKLVIFFQAKVTHLAFIFPILLMTSVLTRNAGYPQSKGYENMRRLTMLAETEMALSLFGPATGLYPQLSSQKFYSTAAYDNTSLLSKLLWTILFNWFSEKACFQSLTFDPPTHLPNDATN